LKWNAESKLIVVTASAPDRLMLWLFNYPAWRAQVNGIPVVIESVPTSGQMSIPVFAGESHVTVTFKRTCDRLWGEIISVGSLVLMLLLTFKSSRRPALAGS
jgi:hypothetical protein